MNQPDDIQQHQHIHQLNDKHTGLSWWNFSKDIIAKHAQYSQGEMYVAKELKLLCNSVLQKQTGLRLTVFRGHTLDYRGLAIHNVIRL